MPSSRTFPVHPQDVRPDPDLVFGSKLYSIYGDKLGAYRLGVGAADMTNCGAGAAVVMAAPGSVERVGMPLGETA